jgi:hypothetical protein
MIVDCRARDAGHGLAGRQECRDGENVLSSLPAWIRK